MTRLETILAALVACVLCGVGGSVAGYIKGGIDKESQNLKQQSIVDAAAQQMRAVTAEEIAKIKITNKTVNQKVLHEITEKTIYSDCRVPASGVQRANEAITGLLSSDSELPKAGNDKAR